MEIITSIKTLMILASEVGKAKKTGDKIKIDEAILKLKQYEEIIRLSDKTMLHFTVRDLK